MEIKKAVDNSKKPVLVSWSSGKDSCYMLHQLLKGSEYEPVGLFSTINATNDRVAMHGVRRELLEKQAKSLEMPIALIDLPWPCSNEDYERIMGGFIEEVKDSGVQYIAFGDLFLEDIRAYREKQLEGTGIAPIFPIWGIPTDRLANEMMKAGIQTRISCVDSRQISASFSGKDWDKELLEALPQKADPCGENGEFHTFVYNSPDFSASIDIKNGDTVDRDGFVYTDIMLS